MPSRIAVIEDDEAARDLTVKLLKGAGYAVGADDFLVKPVAPQELVARIKVMHGRAEQFRRQGARTNGRLIAVTGA